MGLMGTNGNKILVKRLITNVPNYFMLEISFTGKRQRNDLRRMGDLQLATTIMLLNIF